jgi:LmbE family N-acetylglucosaminyl deacetylase
MRREDDPVMQTAGGAPVRMLGVFAHPDDETLCAGGTFARYAARGAEIMVASATRGEAGQIRDARVATRRTIAAVREEELRTACALLGVQHVRVLEHHDGRLETVGHSTLVDELSALIDEFEPDVVVTFGSEGGYGHPDHRTISDATTDACIRRETRQGSLRLYHSYFPQHSMLLLERLACWLTTQDIGWQASLDFVHALLLLAEQTSTMRFVQDHSEVRWYPTGSYVVEQGEASNELFLILSGSAEVLQERESGETEHLRHMTAGGFFGQLGVASHGRRTAHVVATEPLSCLVLSPAEPEKFAPRGQASLDRGMPPSPVGSAAADGTATACIDVAEFMAAKIDALCAYRSQFCLERGMLPDSLMRELFGLEYFIQVLPERQLDTELWEPS